MQVCGIMNATLWVASTANDTDVVVKVEDVFGGTSMLVADSVLRMRWRAGAFATAPTLMTPGVVYQVTVQIALTCYIFNPLHAIRVTIAGTNFPRFSVNNQNGGTVLNPVCHVLLVGLLLLAWRRVWFAALLTAQPLTDTSFARVQGNPVVAATTVYADALHPSALTLPIVDVATLLAMRI